MKRRKTVFEQYERYHKMGKSRGWGATYKPGVTIRNVHSSGLSHRIKGWKTNRTHHFLSLLELHYFYTLEWAMSVVDIREKYLLPPKDTIRICERLGMKHPMDMKTRQPQMMWTDFLIDVRVNDTVKLVAVAVIPESQLRKKREIEKLEIQRMFWHDKGIEFSIATQKQIPPALVSNVAWIHKALHLKDIKGLDETLLWNIEPILFEALGNSYQAFPKVAQQVDDVFKLRRGTCLWIIRHLIANRIWTIDMLVKKDLSKALQVKRNEKLLQVRGINLKNYAHFELRYRVD